MLDLSQITVDLTSQSLVNEGRFPLLEKDLWGDECELVSQSLVNEGRFPLAVATLTISLGERSRVAIPR